MANNEAIAYYEDADEITGYCTADVTGKTFVMISADRQPGGPTWDPTTDPITGANVSVAPCTLGAKVFGVAGYDQVVGNLVPVFRTNRIMPVTAGASITAGQEVQSDANGKAIPLAETNGAKAAAVIGSGTSEVQVTALEEGDEGNYITIQFVDPGGVSATLTVTVLAGNVINVALGRAASAINSTAANVISAINSDSDAAALVVADNGAGGTTGAGLVAAHAAVPLTGGLDTGSGRPAGLAIASCASGDDAQISIYP